MARSLRILYLHQYFLTRESYGTTRSYEFARYLARRGHFVTIITGSRSYLSGERVDGRGRRWLTSFLAAGGSGC